MSYDHEFVKAIIERMQYDIDNCANTASLYDHPLLKEPMMEWLTYQRKGTIELRPYAIGESLTAISVSESDQPKDGDMIARNPNNHEDQWLVNKEYFDANYELRIRETL